MLTFRKIELADKPLLDQFLKNQDTNLFTYCFEVLWLWRDVFEFQYAICPQNNVLFIKTYTNGVHYFLFPVGIGGNLIPCIKLILDSAKQFDCEPIIGQITPANKAFLEREMPDEFTFTANRNESEYIYLSERLRTLAGKKLQPKRNNINFLEKNFAWSTETISTKKIDECVLFSEKWNTTLHSDFEENVAFTEALKSYETLKLDTLALRLNGNVEGISMGCALNKNVYLTLFEKANPQIRGAYSLLNREFCRTYCTDYQFINRAEDAGIEGLRQAKMSYAPDVLQEVFLARRR